VLTLATLGMAVYGLYSASWAIVDLVRGARLELWAELALVGFGLLLGLAAAFVRVALPGGIPLAISAMLGLQALAVHTDAHLQSGLAPQAGRAALAVVLVAIAMAGQRSADPTRPVR
jgi:hypothetical protein